MRIISLIPILALAACVEDSPPNGAMLFAENCAACHGANAQGGSLDVTLTTVPPDLTRIAARNGGVFPRNRVASTIDGLNRDSHFSAAMPEFGAGDLGPLVMIDEGGTPVPIPADLLALTDYLQSIQR